MDHEGIKVDELSVGAQIVAVTFGRWGDTPESIETESIAKLTKTRVVTNRNRWIIRAGVIDGRREGQYGPNASLFRPWDLQLVAIRGKAETHRLLLNARRAADHFAKSPTKARAIALQEILQAWLERDPDE